MHKEAAIQIKPSRLQSLIFVLSSALSCYWIRITDVPVSLCIFCTVALAYVLLLRRRSKKLSGTYRLTTRGEIIELQKDRTTEPQVYQATLIQGLPWCQDIRFVSQGSSFRQLLWLDALNSEDWRKLRVFLTQSCRKTKL